MCVLLSMQHFCGVVKNIFNQQTCIIVSVFHLMCLWCFCFALIEDEPPAWMSPNELLIPGCANQSMLIVLMFLVIVSHLCPFRSWCSFAELTSFQILHVWTWCNRAHDQTHGPLWLACMLVGWFHCCDCDCCCWSGRRWSCHDWQQQWPCRLL